MPTNKPFFPNLRPVKKVVTAQGGILIRKERKCGNEFLVSKKTNGSVVWVEAVEDIVTAKKRLISLASGGTDGYRIWDSTEQRFIDLLDDCG